MQLQLGLFDELEYIPSPLNYIGGKFKIVNQLIPLFPNKINKFVDLFAGGFNIGINVKANKIICNDYINYIIELYNLFKKLPIDKTLNHIEKQIKKYKLTKKNEVGYKEFRSYYNKTKNPLDLYVLICYSFNYRIRFNSSQEFNNSFGRNKIQFSNILRKKLINFIQRLKSLNIEFTCKNFNDVSNFDFNEHDYFYCDPPYLITKVFNGWDKEHEIKLLNYLDELDKKNIKFGLSNVLKHKGRRNEILINWSKKYKINRIEKNYDTCIYNAINNKKNETIEVLITNYKKEKYGIKK